MNDCVFCRIVKGEVPCHKIYEDENTLCFMDMKQVNPGHSLVVHKNHHADLFDTPADDMCDIMRTVKKVSPVLLRVTESDGLNLAMNNLPAAGQVVMHAHVHVIPRRKDDGLALWKGKDMAEGDFKRISAAASAMLKS